MKLRIYNKTLDPNLWDENNNLDPEVKDILLKIADDFYKSTELKGDVQDVLFLGSSANYSWTPSSDIDLHIVIDVSEQKITPDYARKFMDSLAAKWNADHKIEIKGHPVEVYLQDVGEPNSSPELARSGVAIYSLIDDKWMLPPNPQNIKLDVEKIQKKYAKLAKQINELIQTQDIQKLKDLMKSIRNYRNAGLAKGGEFSTENIVFKALRRTNQLTKLKDAINTLYDRGVSLNEGVVDIGRYLIFGVINENLDIVAGKDYRGGGVLFNHEILLQSNPDFEEGNWDHLINWIYKKRTNTLYYYGSINEKQRDSVLGFLKSKYGILNPHWYKVSMWEPDAYKV